MAILDKENVAISEDDSAANRVCTVTVKLTQDEHREVTEHAEGFLLLLPFGVSLDVKRQKALKPTLIA
jgi:hypothetical protein